MNAAMLLCAALMAANPLSASVTVKVVYGTSDESQKAEIEPWISKAVADADSPVTATYTGWITLTGDEKELYSSMMGGRIIKGKAAANDGGFDVEISGFKIGALKRTITLKSGERQVLKLTDYPGPNNIFIAFQVPVSEQAKQRTEAAKANVKTFRLELNFGGQEDKPFYRLIASVPEVGVDRSNPFYRIVQINEEEANKIIDHLTKDGFLDKAIDLKSGAKIPPPTMPGYTMKVVAGDMPLVEDLGWGLPMIHRLDDLRLAFTDAGKKDMDFLLGRLSGFRKQWEAQQPTLEAEVGREDSGVRFLVKDGKTIIDITSNFGIDKATIRRKSEEWPKSNLVRLHLGGLESFKVGGKGFAIEWSVASTGDHEARSSLVSGKRVAEIKKDSPFYSEIRIVGGEKKIPLKDGYFEVPLPAKLFEGNPETISLEWIDFYR